MLSYRQGGRGDIRHRLAAAFDDNVNHSSPPSAVQYVPAGYCSHTSSSVSSLSLGGLTDDTEFDCSSLSWLDNLLPELSSLQSVQCFSQDAACDAPRRCTCFMACGGERSTEKLLAEEERC